MADRYIDFFEVREYGDHFGNESAKLVGVSPLVDVAALRERVLSAAQAVDIELERAGVRRTDKRAGSTDVGVLTDALRGLVRRFYRYLQSLPEAQGVDMACFYAGGKLGELARIKPADVANCAAAVLRGFASQPELVGEGTWHADLSTAHAALTDALARTGNARNSSIVTTADLRAARLRFLHIYNRVAKRLVRGILLDLGRDSEYRLFFLDLQVQEERKLPADEPAAESADESADEPADESADEPAAESADESADESLASA